MLCSAYEFSDIYLSTDQSFKVSDLECEVLSQRGFHMTEDGVCSREGYFFYQVSHQYGLSKLNYQEITCLVLSWEKSLNPISIPYDLVY